MGNCLGNNDKDKTSEEYEPRPTVKNSTKQQWFKLLKVDRVAYYSHNLISKKH